MKRLVLVLAVGALCVPAIAIPAMADPTVTVTHGVLTVPTLTVSGRPNRPLVSIVIRTPSAADAAGAAHDQLHLATMSRSEPATLRKP
jgi:hypothetical protein